MKNLSRIIAGLFLAAGIQGAAQATIYDITGVLNGSSGFGASLFHDASSGNHMSGDIVAQIIEEQGLFGTYNDATGELQATGLNIEGGGSFSLNGILVFSGGVLAGNSQLDADFSGTSDPDLYDTTLGFLPGYVCCGKTGFDPNSFMPDGDKMIMTLWGADFMGGTLYRIV